MGKLAHSQLGREVMGLCGPSASPGSFPGGGSSFPQPLPCPGPAQPNPAAQGTGLCVPTTPGLCQGLLQTTGIL